MTRTGSGRSPVSKGRGQTSRRNEIVRRQSASAHISTVREIWLNDFSIRSSNVVVSPPATTGSQPTILPSSSLHLYGFGYVLMSPRPNARVRPAAVAARRAWRPACRPRAVSRACVLVLRLIPTFRQCVLALVSANFAPVPPSLLFRRWAVWVKKTIREINAGGG